MNRNYHVRDILALTKDKIWELPDGGLYLTFDNGETKPLPTRKIIEMTYYWKMFLRWPGADILPEHFIEEEYYGLGTHTKMATTIFWAVFFGHVPNYMLGQGQKIIWEMSRYIYEISNEIYNDSISMLGEYPVSLDIEDIMEIMEQDNIVQAKAGYRAGKATVKDTHDAVYNAVIDKTIPDFHLNPVRLGMLTGALNRIQATQVIGPRAFIPDINGVSPKTPIYDGYADGLTSQYDRMRESRAASISLYMASGPLEDSEYNNRMCQLLCGVINGVDYHDCGGSHAVDWVVEESDLKCLAGKFYIKDGLNVPIKGTETELIGTVIKLRTITTCDNHDPTRPCSYCLGLNALVIPPKTILGIHMTIEPLSRISQTILSTKHVLASIKTFRLDINKTNARFLRLKDEHEHNAFLTKEAVEGGFFLRVKQDEILFINDILKDVNVEALTPERYTCLQNMQIIEYNKNGQVRNIHDLSVAVCSKGSSFTREFLLYLKGLDWENITRDKIEFPLSTWDYNLPFLKTPRVGEDITALLEATKTFMHGTNKPDASRAIDFLTPEGALRSLLNIMNVKIQVNFAHIEIFVRALMAKGETSYELPRGGEPFRFIKLKEAIQNRGMGAALAFEGQPDMIFNPKTYTKENEVVNGTELDHQVM